MKRLTWFALVFAVAATFGADELYARGGGGGRGGARPGGGRSGPSNLGSGNRGGGSQFGGGDFGGLKSGGVNQGNAKLNGNQFGNGQLGDGQFGDRQTGKSGPQQFDNPFANKKSHVGAQQNKTSQLRANFASAHEPFSPGWYADHPGAWQYTHPHADAWAVASLGTAAAWLGAGAYPVYQQDITVQTSDDETASDDSSQAQPTEEAAEDALTAAELAARGDVDLPSDTEFLPLGVFALAPANQQDAAAVVQLSVSKDGIVRGSYADLVTDQGQTVYGAIDKPSQRVAFTVGREGTAVLETTLPNLTSSTGAVVLYLPNGDGRDWSLARYEDSSQSK